VPVERDGSADGVLQTGQRIGMAAIAVTGEGAGAAFRKCRSDAPTTRAIAIESLS
jgi:hypothetical protein